MSDGAVRHHLRFIAGDDLDSVDRLRLFTTAHPEVSFGFLSGHAVAEWHDGQRLQRWTRVLLTDLLDALDGEFPTPAVPVLSDSSRSPSASDRSAKTTAE